MFLNLLLIFAIVQFIADEARRRTERKKSRREYEHAISEATGSMGFMRKDSENLYFTDTLGKDDKKSTFDVTVKPVVSIDSDAITPVATPDEGIPGGVKLNKSPTPKQTGVVEVKPQVPSKDRDSEKQKAS